QETQKAQDKINGKSLKPIVIGNGEKVTKQSVSANKEVLPNSKVLLLTDSDLTMPDMTGWSKEEVVAFELLTKTKVTTKGSGFVSNQSVTKGQKISSKDKIEVTLSSEDVNGQTSKVESDSNKDSDDQKESEDNKDSKDKEENKDSDENKDSKDNES
ncbi:MAG: PASTA domain-containing protein, partial [Staphylococcus xylosus]